MSDIPEITLDVAIAALVMGVVACVGVLALTVALCCFILRLRKKRRELVVNDDLEMAEKSPVQHTVSDAAENLTRHPHSQREGSVSVGVGTLRQVSLSLLQDLLLNLYNLNIKRTTHAPPETKKATGSPRKMSDQSTVTSAGADEVQKQLKAGLDKIFLNDPAKIDTFLSLGQVIMAASTVRQLMDTTFRVMRVCLGVVRQWGLDGADYVGVVPTEGQGHVELKVEDEVNSLVLSWDAHKFSPDLLDTVSMVCQALRDERRQPTPGEYLAVQLAYHLLAKGQHMSDSKHHPLGCPGFRPHVQTQLALTDSGYGHVLGTSRRSDWLQGVVVHVQHIGELEDDTERAPSLFDFSKVRLHIGDACPTTFFISRRLGHASAIKMASEAWEAELSKVVQLTAATVSAAFYQGASACHLSMAGLTTAQAASFMCQLRAHVQRERHVQALSAVWDLATPLTDDYGVEAKPEGAGIEEEEAGPTDRQVRVITEPHHIAKRAMEITLVGGFDQVTWFSSCDNNNEPAERVPSTSATPDTPKTTRNTLPKFKSSCVLRRLTSQQILTLVHQAHGLGLLTYFTGGVTCEDIRPAVLGGVDGVGVGGVGMLHHEGIQGGDKLGPYMEENIPLVLACRDEAARSVTGRGAYLLSRLDTMFFEGSLSSAENGLRKQLHNALIDKDESNIKSIMAKLEDIQALPIEYGHPLMGTARRLVARKAPALKEIAVSAYEWAMFVTRLRTQVGRADEASVCEEYDGEPWHTYRKRYREQREGFRGFFRQVSFEVQLKTTF